MKKAEKPCSQPCSYRLMKDGNFLFQHFLFQHIVLRCQIIKEIQLAVDQAG